MVSMPEDPDGRDRPGGSDGRENTGEGFSYTARPRPEFDARVQSDLELIAARLLEDFPNQIEALILVGSFGRGEGTMLVKGQDVCPVHDYDIVVVTRVDLPHDRLSSASRDLANRLGLPHVDLFSYRRQQLAAFGLSVFALDLKSAGHIFYGDTTVLDAIRPMDPSRLPVDEARRLLFNRLTCLLESIHEGDFHRPPEGDDAFRVAYMASKVILCSVEALLIENGEYHPSYREREARFLARFKRHTRIGGLVRTATAIKLRGLSPQFDVIRYWMWARRFYLTVLFRIVCRSYETPLADWWDLASFYDRWMYFLWRKMWNFVFNRPKYNEWVAIQKRVKLELAEIFLQLARESRDRIRSVYLAQARKFLAAVSGTSGPADWEEARRQAVEWDYHILHPH
jgi:hypothetical protein